MYECKREGVRVVRSSLFEFSQWDVTSARNLAVAMAVAVDSFLQLGAHRSSPFPTYGAHPIRPAIPTFCSRRNKSIGKLGI